MRGKKRHPFPVLYVLVVLTACAGNPEKVLLREPPPETSGPVRPFQILDYKIKTSGEDIPEWIDRYLNEGISGIEAMFEYQDRYVFIREDSGTHVKALEQWSSGFSIPQDLPRLVAARIQARLTRVAAGNPDAAYGRYFENVIRNASDASYSGARKEADFWLIKQYLAEDGETADSEVYAFYVLVSIEREVLKQEINRILNEVKTDVTKDQAAAIERMKEIFFTDF